VAKQLDVRYVVEGSVRKAGGRIRINAQLIDAKTGTHLWAERYDREAADVFDLQDEVRTKILTALTLRLTPEEKKRVERRETTNPEAYDRWMRGRYALSNSTRQSLEAAIQQFERAVAQDPSFARAYGSLANALISQVSKAWARNPDENVDRAMGMAARAVAIDDTLPEARLVLARVYIRKRNYDRALSEIDKAIAFDPNYADGYAYRASVLVYSGRPQDALTDIDKASRMDAATPSWYHDVRGRALFSAESYKAAATAFKNSLQQNPKYNQSRLFLAAAYAHMGALDEAAWELSELDASGVHLSLDYLKTRLPFRNSSDTERVLQGLRKAGLPE
jgi:adenylate cyclase